MGRNQRRAAGHGCWEPDLSCPGQLMGFGYSPQQPGQGSRWPACPRLSTPQLQPLIAESGFPVASHSPPQAKNSRQPERGLALALGSQAPARGETRPARLRPRPALRWAAGQGQVRAEKNQRIGHRGGQGGCPSIAGNPHTAAGAAAAAWPPRPPRGQRKQGASVTCAQASWLPSPRASSGWFPRRSGWSACPGQEEEGAVLGSPGSSRRGRSRASGRVI